MDVQVYEAMKKGDQVLADLQSQTAIDKFEEIYERIQDNVARQEKERELFGQPLDDEELQGELDALDALDVAAMLPSAGEGRIESSQR